MREMIARGPRASTGAQDPSQIDVEPRSSYMRRNTLSLLAMVATLGIGCGGAHERRKPAGTRRGSPIADLRITGLRSAPEVGLGLEGGRVLHRMAPAVDVAGARLLLRRGRVRLIAALSSTRLCFVALTPETPTARTGASCWTAAEVADGQAFVELQCQASRQQPLEVLGIVEDGVQAVRLMKDRHVVAATRAHANAYWLRTSQGADRLVAGSISWPLDTPC